MMYTYDYIDIVSSVFYYVNRIILISNINILTKADL